MTSLLPASKFTFDPQHSKWIRERVRVQIAKHPFAQGGMRVVYRMREFDERINNGEYIECVAKKFKPDCEEKQYYYDEAMTQMVCESYAQEFNKRRTGYYLGFLPVSVLRLDQEGYLYNTEPYLRGDYQKHNDNAGHVDTKILVPQAFSHFTYESSNQTLIVVDIQGVGDYYTDPQIHSFNGDGFGLGNLGQSGIRKFLQTHKCNAICKMLGLTDPKKGPQSKKIKETDEEMAKRLQEEELKTSPEYQNKLNWTSQRYTQEVGKLDTMIQRQVGKLEQQYKQAQVSSDAQLQRPNVAGAKQQTTNYQEQPSKLLQQQQQRQYSQHQQQYLQKQQQYMQQNQYSQPQYGQQNQQYMQQQQMQPNQQAYSQQGRSPQQQQRLPQRQFSEEELEEQFQRQLQLTEQQSLRDYEKEQANAKRLQQEYYQQLQQKRAGY